MSRSCSTRGKYGDGARQEKFTYALSLVFIQCVINAAFAKLRESGPRSGLPAGLPALRGSERPELRRSPDASPPSLSPQ